MLQHKMKVGSVLFLGKYSKFEACCYYNNNSLAPEMDEECCGKDCGILYEFLHKLFMKILAIFHSKIFCKNQGNFSDKECSQKKFGLVPIITTSLF